MRIVTAEGLVQACRQRRERAGASMTMPLDRVWQCMLRWIVHQLGRCNGATIPHLCTLTWRADGGRPGTAGTAISRGQPLSGQRYRAICIFHERFLQDLALKTRAPTAAATRTIELVKTEGLSCTRLALNFSTDLSKDQVFSCSRELVGAIFALVGEERELAIEFGTVGLLCVRERQVSFEFAPEYVPAAERDAAAARLTEIRKLAVPSNDPMLNRYADVPLEDIVLSGQAAKDPRPSTGAAPPQTAHAAAIRRRGEQGGGGGTPLRRGHSANPLARTPLAAGQLRHLSGADMLVLPAGASALAGGGLALATLARDPSGRRASVGAGQATASQRGTAGMSARAAAAKLPPARPPPPPKRAPPPAPMQLSALVLDADELELENLGLSPVPRLLPGQGAKHTPPVCAASSPPSPSARAVARASTMRGAESA